MFRPLRAVVLAVVLGGLLALCAAGCDSRTAGNGGAAGAATASAGVRATPGAAGLRTISPGHLPPEARETLRLITAGGPYPYRQDGVVFQNRERLLPGEPSGYYREFTVLTPGSADRGARRIIAGKNGERYYTADHYRTFVVVGGDR
ncbi:MAG: guanyl-specific ribonuclease Sa [Streptosporangiaceae bacterium]|jgi:ribonuclease T1|nr:guanyl-specific ribonuclease Sa [Streptosporangiaceae bacterium]